MLGTNYINHNREITEKGKGNEKTTIVSFIDVELPFGTKWVCCNMGVTTPEGYGGYNVWGEKR